MAACGNYGMPQPEDGGDCEDCVQVVKTTKKVRVPCHRNTYKQYTVKVPRQVNEKVARDVQYTTYEDRTKQVAYQTTRSEQRIKMQEQKYQVPVTRTCTKMVSVTKKVPKTIYVDVCTQVPKQETTTHMETRTRMVKIPYNVQVPETKYRTVQYKEPVQRTKTIYDNVSKTVYDTQVRTRCEPKVTYVTKEIPVFNVVARPAQPCPPEQPCAPCGETDVGVGAPISAGLQQEFNALDTNNDGMLSAQEYATARNAADQGMSGGGGHGGMTPYSGGY